MSDFSGNEQFDAEDYDPLSDDLLLSEMVRAIVAYPERVEVEEYCDATKPSPIKVLVVRVDDRDCGKVIGKQGRMAELLRSFMTTVGMHHGYSMTVVIEGSNNHQQQQQRRPAYKNYKKREPIIEYKTR